jgi:hypothetical protein
VAHYAAGVTANKAGVRCALTIVGGVREARQCRRGCWKTVCTRGSNWAWVPGPSTHTLGFVLRLGKVEVVFLSVAVVIVVGIAWFLINAPQQVGRDRSGTILYCMDRTLNSPGGDPRMCTVRLSDNTIVTAYDQTHIPHERVMVTEMRHRLSQRVYYTVVPVTNPNNRSRGP